MALTPTICLLSRAPTETSTERQAQGGAHYQGTVFRIGPNGTLTTLYSFCSQPYCADGVVPTAGLIQATDGNFYGTTEGSVSSNGTVFKITPKGKLTTLYSFADFSRPLGALVQAADGNLYGTTVKGGTHGAGTVFRITPEGTLTTLYSFCSLSACADGSEPYAGPIMGNDGNLYGTTQGGGTNGNAGVVYKITPTGSLTTLYSFCSQPNCADGFSPLDQLAQGTDGNFYGTTSYAGAGGETGTVFEITPTGSLTTLYSFCSQPNCADGGNPYAGLALGTDGDLYGTTGTGGANSDSGTIFKMTTKGQLTTLYSFCAQNGCSDGGSPTGGLLQATDGTFYGATYGGGTGNDQGTVFRLSVGLGSFVKTQTTSGKVGAAVIILGTDLTGATGVSFNGTAATFTVPKSSEIKAKVPASATTGTVTVTTPSGTLISNVPFRVTPQIKSFKPMSGPVGTQVKIKGVSLTQTTGVAFGGATATFTVDSDKQIVATVPTGATTGPIIITTLGGTATSTTTFTVQ